MQEVHALLAQQWEQIQTLAQALERQRVLTSDGAYSSNTTMTATVADISHDNNTVIQEKENQAPAFDLEKYRLGKLCPKGHEFESGMSLLRKHNQSCRDCENEGKKARRQAKRQALEATSA